MKTYSWTNKSKPYLQIIVDCNPDTATEISNRLRCVTRMDEEGWFS